MCGRRRRCAGRLAPWHPAGCALTIENIEPVDTEQRALFPTTPVDDDELLARQGIVRPQGLESLADLAWHEETDNVEWSPARGPHVSGALSRRAAGGVLVSAGGLILSGSVDNQAQRLSFLQATGLTALPATLLYYGLGRLVQRSASLLGACYIFSLIPFVGYIALVGLSALPDA